MDKNYFHFDDIDTIFKDKEGLWVMRMSEDVTVSGSKNVREMACLHHISEMDGRTSMRRFGVDQNLLKHCSS